MLVGTRRVTWRGWEYQERESQGGAVNQVAGATTTACEPKGEAGSSPPLREGAGKYEVPVLWDVRLGSRCSLVMSRNGARWVYGPFRTLP